MSEIKTVCWIFAALAGATLLFIKSETGHVDAAIVFAGCMIALAVLAR